MASYRPCSASERFPEPGASTPPAAPSSICRTALQQSLALARASHRPMISVVTAASEIAMHAEDSAARYRDIVENASDLIFAVDLDDRITSVNAAFERALGHSREDLIGQPLLNLVA